MLARCLCDVRVGVECVVERGESSRFRFWKVGKWKSGLEGSETQLCCHLPDQHHTGHSFMDLYMPACTFIAPDPEAPE